MYLKHYSPARSKMTKKTLKQNSHKPHCDFNRTQIDITMFRICDLTWCNRSTVNKLEGRVRGPFPTTLRQKIRQYRSIVASMQRTGSGVFRIQRKTKPSPNRDCQCKQLLYYIHHIVSTLAYSKAFYLYMLHNAIRWQMAAMSTAYVSTGGRRQCMALDCDAIGFDQPFKVQWLQYVPPGLTCNNSAFAHKVHRRVEHESHNQQWLLSYTVRVLVLTIILVFITEMERV